MQKVKLPKDALAARIVFVIGLMIIVGMMVTFIVVLIFPQPASQETCGCMSPSAQIFFLFINFRTICDFVRLFVFSYRLGNFICSRSHDRTGGSKNFEKA